MAGERRLPEAIARVIASTDERSTSRSWRVWDLVRFGVFLVPIAQVLVLLWVIWTRTAHVPFWDEWETVLIVQHYTQGTLTWQEIWALHAAAHRIVTTRIIDLILIELTHWNRQVEMTFDLGAGVAAAAVLVASVRRTLGSVHATLALVVPLSLLLLSFAQYANWFAPFQLQIIVIVLCVAGCVKAFSAERLGWEGLGLAMFCAVIASISALEGVLVWIAFFPNVMAAGYRKSLVWAASGTAVWLAYFWQFPHSAQRPTLQADLTYVLAYLGAPLGYPDALRAFIFGDLSLGVFMAALTIYWLRHKTFRILAPWIGLALFALGCAQTTALGRWTYGPSQAIASRYQTFSALWWVALLVIAGVLVKEVFDWLRVHDPDIVLRARRRRAVAGASIAVLLIVCASLALVNGVGLQDGLIVQDSQRQDEQAIVDYRVAPNGCLMLYYPWPDLLRPRAAFLDQQHLAIFADATARTQAGVQNPVNLPAGCAKPHSSLKGS